MTFITDRFPELLHVLLASDVRELEISEGDVRLRVHRAPAEGGGEPVRLAVEEEVFASHEPSSVLVRASHVGTFYRAGKPGMAPLVTEGSRVEESTVIGIIEALHVLTDIEAECRGVVIAVLATDGQPVEYNQPLLEVQPDE